MAEYIQLPNGAYFEVKQGETPLDAMMAARQLYPDVFKAPDKTPKQDTTGFKAAAAAGLERLKGETALTAGKLGLMGLEEAERYQREREEAARKRFTPTEKGWSEDPFLKFRETLGGSVPYIAAPAAAGLAALAAPVAAPTAALIGAGAAGLASAGQFTGSNLASQMETGKTLEEASLGKAAAAAVPQALLDTAAMALMPGVGKLFGSVGSKLTNEQAKAIASQTLGKTVADYTARTGAAMTREGLTEAAQQALERVQAGLEIDNPEARKEYIESFIGGAALAGAGAPIGRAFERAGARGQARRADEEAAAAAAAQEEAAKNQPEALLKLDQDYQAARQQMQALTAAAKKPGKGATPEQMQAYEQAKADRSEFLASTFQPLKSEWESRQAQINQLKTQQAGQEEQRLQTMEQEAAPQQPTAAAPVPNAPPRLNVVNLMEEQNQLNSELDAMQTQLAAAAQQADTETIATLTPLYQDLQKRVAERAQLIEEQGGVAKPLDEFQKESAAQLKALDKQLKDAEKALVKAGDLGDFEQMPALAQKVQDLRAQRQQAGAEIETKTQMAKFVAQPKGTVTEMFEGAKPVDEAKVAETQAAEAERAQYGKGSPTQLAPYKAPELEAKDRAELDKFMDDLFSLENRVRVAKGEKVLTEREKEQKLLEGREEFPGQRRVRAAIFNDLIPDPKERARFKNGTASRVLVDDDGKKIRLQEVYDKGGEPAVEYEMVMDAIRQARRKVTTKQRNAKKSLLDNLYESAAELEKLYAQRESGLAVPTMREKVAGAQAALGKGEAPGERQMDASERYNLDRKIKGLENKYNSYFAQVAKVRDEILALQNSLYKTEPIKKRSVEQAEKAKESRVYRTQVEQGPQAFMAALEKIAKPSTGEKGLLEINKIELDLEPSKSNDKTVYFKLIRALKGAEKGAASDVLRKVVDLADRHGVRLELQVEQVGKTGLTAQQLEDWYARNGFKRGDMGMYRNPQPVEIQKVSKSRSASLAQRYARGDYRKEAEDTKDMRDLAVKLGREEEAYKKARTEATRRYKALIDRYGKEDEKTQEYLEFARIELKELATKLGKATPEYKATLKEQIEYMKAAYESAGKQEVKSKRDKTPVMRKQTAAPKEVRTGSPESRARSQALFQMLQDAKEAIAREREEGIYGDGNWREGEGKGGIDLDQAQKMIDGLKIPEGVKFKYVPTWDKAPIKVLKEAAAQGLTPDQLVDKKGVVLRDGSVYVFGESHANLKDLEETIAHELIGHYAVEGLLGEKGMAALYSKLKAQPGGMLKLADDLGVGVQVRAAIEEAKAGGIDPEVANKMGFRELFAYVEEQRPTESFVKKAGRFLKEIVGALRKAFADMGLVELKTATANDIFKILRDARTAFKEGTIGAYPAKEGGLQFRSGKIQSPTLAAMVGEKPGVISSVKANVLGLGARQNFVDRFASISSAIKGGVDKGVLTSLEGEQAEYYLRFGEMRNMFVGQSVTNGVPRLVSEQSKRGTEFMFKSKPGANLVRVAELAGKAKLGNEATTEAYLTAYIAGQRAEQLEDGWRKLSTDPDKAKAAYKEVVDKLKANPEAKKAFDDAVKEYQQYNANLMDLLAESGRISRKEAARLKSTTYVPFYRVRNGEVEMIVDGEAVMRIGNIKNQPQLHELVGSNDKILPLYTSAMQNTAMIVGMAMDNVRTKNTAYALQKLGVVTKMGDGDGPSGPNTVRFREHGARKFAVIEHDVYGIPADLMVKSLEGITTSIPAVIRMMGIPADILRTFVTRNPAYAFRQAIRDPMAAWLTTGTDSAPVFSSLKELSKMVAGRSETERKLMEAGAITSNVYTGDTRDMDKFLRDMSSGKSGWEKAMAKLDAFAMQGDAATRAVIYNDSIKKGMTEMQALMRTLESMNFSRRGLSPSMQMLSTLIPFFNAQIQGLDVLYRAAKGDMPFSERLKIQEKLVKRGLLLAATAVTYAMFMQDDEAYRKARPEERYANFFVRLPFFDEPVRVPIPFELGYIFKSLPEAVFNAAFTDEKAEDAAKGLAKLFAQSNPFALPQAIKPLTEVVLGKSFYSGDIESSRERALLPTERYRDTTTELSKLIGSVTGDVGLTPIKLDYLVRGYTGAMGVAFMQLLNPLLRQPGPEGEVQKPTKKTSELPIIGSLFQPNDGRGIVEAAYDRMEEVKQAKASVKRLMDEGRRAEAMALAQEYSNQLAASSMAGAAQQALGTIAKQIRAVKADPKLTTEEKDAKLKALVERQNLLAEKFLAKVDRTTPQ